MIKMFENGVASWESKRESMGLGIDDVRDVAIMAQGVTVEIAGQKKDDIDIKLTGLANVNVGIADGEVVVRAVKQPAADVKPVIRVYLPINVGIDRLDVSVDNADIVVDSVVKRPFIKVANLMVHDEHRRVRLGAHDLIDTMNLPGHTTD